MYIQIFQNLKTSKTLWFSIILDEVSKELQGSNGAVVKGENLDSKHNSVSNVNIAPNF